MNAKSGRTFADKQREIEKERLECECATFPFVLKLIMPEIINQPAISKTDVVLHDSREHSFAVHIATHRTEMFRNNRQTLAGAYCIFAFDVYYMRLAEFNVDVTHKFHMRTNAKQNDIMKIKSQSRRNEMELRK